MRPKETYYIDILEKDKGLRWRAVVGLLEEIKDFGFDRTEAGKGRELKIVFFSFKIITVLDSTACCSSHHFEFLGFLMTEAGISLPCEEGSVWQVTLHTQCHPRWGHMLPEHWGTN